MELDWSDTPAFHFPRCGVIADVAYYSHGDAFLLGATL